ncbi:Flp pilus assembly protein CpaB [Lentzea sp. BCCO 10_0856]|uniref:Flp pilus assembly protein CpaB n=1 Tax=Lentzea miocenica TaxID=3095431 RepID=A0ABU4TDZ2_9PSEU|nr:Flp pilus assembly protein CpaB [Lentzea sp. BCCO 10_0856]MDX8036249.1 Flp pilus assembly protein CpaB [Lentzea sp. BCCO 10_0856]
MKNRALIIILAVLLAVCGSVGVFLYVRAADSRAIAGQQAVTVLVANERIPAGTTAESLMKLVDRQQMPKSTVPENAMSELDTSIASLVTSSEIAEGQLVTKSLFTEQASLAKGISIPDGMIAVTVPTEAWQRAGGLIQKGSKVAVFDTFTVMEGQGNTPAGDGLSKQYERNQSTRLLLTGLEVLSVVDEKKAAEDGDVGKAIVTVAVKQVDAEKLIHGQQTGTLYFALLGGKSEITPGNGVDNRSLFGN